MTSLSIAQNMINRVPKYIVASSLNAISSIHSRTLKIPARYDLLRQAASDRLLLNWFDSAWRNTKNKILDNWESAGLIKKRAPTDDYRKSGTTSINKGSKSDKEHSDKAKNDSALDEIAKAKNKAQRHLAEDWDAVNRVNSRTNEKLLDNVKERTTSTIDDLSKSVKEKGLPFILFF